MNRLDGDAAGAVKVLVSNPLYSHDHRAGGFLSAVSIACIVCSFDKELVLPTNPIRIPCFAPTYALKPLKETLVTSVKSVAGDGNSESETVVKKLADHPAISKQWELYVENEWWPWAAEDRRLLSVQDVYTDLFSAYQKHKRLGEMFEVVIGIGLLTWRPPHGPQLILASVLGLTLTGVAFGLGGSFLITRLPQGHLYGLNPADPITFAGSALLWAVVALIASYIPVRRATRVDPTVTLRYE